jgi:Mannosyltransferase putative
MAAFPLVLHSGGEVLMLNAFVLITVLREQLKCELPIEIVYGGSQEMAPSTKDMFEVQSGRGGV